MRIGTRSIYLLMILVLLYLSLVPSSLALAASESHVSVRSIESVGFTVSDMDRSVAFYHDVLTFKPICEVESRSTTNSTASLVCGRGSSGCNWANSSSS